MKRGVSAWPSLLLLGASVQLAAGQGPRWTPNEPLPRYSHSAVLDPSTKQMIIYGGFSGFNGQHLDVDIWRLLPSASLSGVQNWVALRPGGTPPPPRGAHFAGYDPGSNRMVVFGGTTGTGVANDVWVLTNANGNGGPAVWSQLSPLGGPPPPREYMGGAYDPISNTLMVYGGCDCISSTAFNDYWLLANANGLGGSPTWTEVPTGLGGPGMRFGQTTVYDQATNELIFFAGLSGFTKYDFNNDVWALKNATTGHPVWEQLLPQGQQPQPVAYGSATYDPASNVMTIFSADSFGAWILTHANGTGGPPAWNQIGQNYYQAYPAVHAYATSVYDASRNIMIVVGGLGYAPVNDVFFLTDANGQ